MPWFALVGHDASDVTEKRQSLRGEHLAKLQALDAERRLRHAGPLLDEAGKPVGSLVIFEAKSLEAAQAIVDEDPYVQQGVFERYDLRETWVVFPKRFSEGP